MRLFLILILSTLSFLSVATQQEFYKSFGEYTIQYTAINTTDIDSDVAKQAGLPRSKKIGLLNIVALKNEIQSFEPHMIKLSVFNLLGQEVPLDLLIHKEQTSVYYLATFRKYENDNLWFKIEIQFTPESKIETFKFTKEVFIQ
ncbi:MAG: DUF4426 domain-containing protein [Saccharospirillaceae bacterium]|nr:DUF4426 domain-containing protein [Pseudomonadales bacterium]NRB78949.1 DUF4426 domain-containing protein [Saccharospirillaceae bacterium]